MHRLVILALALLSAMHPASARDFGQYDNQPPEVRAWYRNAELTEAAQRRLFPATNGRIKCCDHADVVHTQFRVDRKSGADEWWWLDGVTWRRVPPDIIHWGEHAPDGQSTLFVWQGKETCFYPGDGGI